MTCMEKLYSFSIFARSLIQFWFKNPTSITIIQKQNSEIQQDYFEPIEKIQFFKQESYLISYLDIYKILNMQSSLIEIYKNAIHFCKNV